MEFEGARLNRMDANPVAVVEALIHINNQLHQHEVTVSHLCNTPMSSLMINIMSSDWFVIVCLGCGWNIDLCTTKSWCSTEGVMVQIYSLFRHFIHIICLAFNLDQTFSYDLLKKEHCNVCEFSHFKVCKTAALG